NKTDPTDKQPVHGNRIEQHMNIFRLAQTVNEALDHNFPFHLVPQTRTESRNCSGKYFCQSAIVKCHHSVRSPQNPALCIAYCSKRTCARTSGEEPAYRHIAAGVKSSKSLGILTGRFHESTRVASTAIPQLCSEPTPASGLATKSVLRDACQSLVCVA